MFSLNFALYSPPAALESLRTLRKAKNIKLGDLCASAVKKIMN